MADSRKYKLHTTILPRKCAVCGKLYIGKGVRELAGWSWQYFCCPKCAREHYRARLVSDRTCLTKTDEFHCYMEENELQYINKEKESNN